MATAVRTNEVVAPPVSQPRTERGMRDFFTRLLKARLAGRAARGALTCLREVLENDPRDRHRIEPNARIQLQHEQRDVGADERATHQRVGEHAEVLHRLDYTLADAAGHGRQRAFEHATVR